VGGAVKGQQFVGRAPPVSIANSGASEDQWHVGSGSLLPSTSIDQFASTLASWFGVPGSDLGLIMPNVGNFGGYDYPVNLGFMA
jgi:uncharacterized protein (DUF1501 family)